MNFLIELIKRLGTQTPWFFTVLKTIAAITAIITGLPLLLANAGIDLPDSWDTLANKIVAVAATVAGIVAQLTTTTEDKKKEGIKD